MKAIFEPAYGRLVSNLHRLRIERGMRQEDVGRRLHVTRHWVSKVESCQLRLDLVQFVRLCRVYGVRASDLLGELESDLSDDGSLFTYQGSGSFYSLFGGREEKPCRGRKTSSTCWGRTAFGRQGSFPITGDVFCGLSYTFCSDFREARLTT